MQPHASQHTLTISSFITVTLSHFKNSHLPLNSPEHGCHHSLPVLVRSTSLMRKYRENCKLDLGLQYSQLVGRCQGGTISVQNLSGKSKQFQ